MTDELMDARLHEAGERWRHASDAQASAPTSESLVELTTTARRRRARWGMLASAAAVVALGAGLTAFFVTRTDDHGTHVAGPSGAPAAPIVGPTWQLVRIVDGNGRPVVAAGKATLHIPAGGDQLTGSDGCNHLSAHIVTTPTSVRIEGGVATTEIGCADNAIAATARVVDQFFIGTFSWRIQNDGRLVLTRSGAGTLTYAKVATGTNADPVSLDGRWRLTGVEHDSAGSGTSEGSSDMGTSITVKGRLIEISHACYVNRGNAAVGRGTITITGVTLERAVPCPSNAAGKYDSTVDRVLDGTCTWTIQDGQLSITKGGVTLTFGR